ncbi:hypothetical protein [Streptococcus parasanguinis]|uniref:hypothetical protein n=1 Tax=Streptococcus parasanguinis TaxID=1318 RepID=UPI00066E8BF0|nr:hypothetical protein [Streptococcus parasanguinis]
MIHNKSSSIQKLEKEAKMLENEKEIKKCFSKKSNFWGIDKCELSLIDFNIDILNFTTINSKKDTKVFYNSNHKLLQIEIKSEKFGKLTISFDESGYKKEYARIELINPTLNFGTVGIHGIKQRLANAILLIKNEYGISITYKDAIFKLIELAFTVSFEKKPHLQVRRFLIECLSLGRSPNFIQHKNKKNNSEYSILTCKSRKDASYVLYNKIEKAKVNRQIRRKNSSLENVDVQRFELTLKNQKIKQELGLNTINDLTDQKIIEYLENHLMLASLQYIKAIKSSIKECEKKLHDTFSNYSSQRYIPQFILELENYSSEELKPLMIDEEIITFMNPTFIKNKARTKRTLLKTFQKENCQSLPMVSWQVLDIINLMFISLEDARNTGLGFHTNSTSVIFHKIRFKNFSKKEKLKTFEKTIKKMKRNIEYQVDCKLKERFSKKKFIAILDN